MYPCYLYYYVYYLCIFICICFQSGLMHVVRQWNLTLPIKKQASCDLYIPRETSSLSFLSLPPQKSSLFLLHLFLSIVVEGVEIDQCAPLRGREAGVLPMPSIACMRPAPGRRNAVAWHAAAGADGASKNLFSSRMNGRWHASLILDLG